ncbi:MAG TPA: MFS transporter [Gemmatimonadales bacterium]|jgi:MFS family permease
MHWVSSRAAVATRLALDRNTGAVATAVFLMTLGEELWKRFLPKFLQDVGAPMAVIGGYGSLRDLVDGVAQYPGGWASDRWGRKRALQCFTLLAFLGYLTLASSSSWPLALSGIALTMAWSSMASPTMFAVIGDALPAGRRVLGFTVQSILRRVPIAIAPVLGGMLIAGRGVQSGVRVGLMAAAGLAVVTFTVLSVLSLQREPATPAGARGVWQLMPPPLRRLLLSDILIRCCEGLVDVLLVLYALDVVGISAASYGGLVAVQMGTSILSYVPGAWLGRRVGSKPVIMLTFVAFALFPLAVVAATSYVGLVLAFVVGGLRELGEPARKGLIVDLARPEYRGRSVGLYYLIRSVAISPAATVGALAWSRSPTLPFLTAGMLGLAGTLAFALAVEEPRRGGLTLERMDS